ncbi:MAG: patatin-like phospholipase family protein, partial [Deltaproteobacteria bacterium]|nr:patatin-like phospholipase family protein [Deltaproteobacteria bacterium]
MTEQSTLDVAESTFDAVVFAGGGCRCFWQVGFWEALSAKIPVAPRHISCVSAGSAMAAMIFGGRIAEGMAHFLEITAANDKNAYPERLFRKAPVFPHEAMYSGALRAALDADALAALLAGPPIDVLVARPPRWLPGLGALAFGMGSYNIERHLRHGLHPTWPEKLGYGPELISFQEVIAEYPHDTAAAAEAVIDLVLASSCSPPLTPL